MYDNMGGQAWGPRPPLNPKANPFSNAFGAGPGLIRGGLGANGEKIFGSNSEHTKVSVCISVACPSDSQMMVSINSHMGNLWIENEDGETDPMGFDDDMAGEGRGEGSDGDQITGNTRMMPYQDGDDI